MAAVIPIIRMEMAPMHWLHDQSLARKFALVVIALLLPVGLLMAFLAIFLSTGKFDFPALAELGIGVTAYGVLSRGLLSGSSTGDRQDLRSHLPRFTGANRQRNDALVGRLSDAARARGCTTTQLAQLVSTQLGALTTAQLTALSLTQLSALTTNGLPGLTPTQLALAWCYSRWFVGSTIIGATTLEQLQENIDALDVTLSPDIVAAIDDIHARFTNPGQ